MTQLIFEQNLKLFYPSVSFVRGLPIRKINGIGNVTEQLLKGVCGVETVGDMYDSRGVIKILFSEISYTSFLRIALGEN